MGEVWLAEQQNIGTRVAIKVLHSQISADTEHVQRFFNEARAVSRIQHAGIVKIFDVGHHAGQAYLIMEYLEGETLAKRLERVGKLPLVELCDVGRQIASVLEATHSAGITHRDLKPDNIYLVPDRELPRGERVKILDFGIAKLTGTLASNSPRTIGTMGTPAYMAPEQWGDASKVDWRADLYSLGCVAFEMACGRPPFIVTTIAEACAKHLHELPSHASELEPSVPPALDRLLDKLLEKDPAARLESMKAVARAFDGVEKQALGTASTVSVQAIATSSATLPPQTNKRAPIAIVAGGVAVAAAVGGFMLVRSSSKPAHKPIDAAVALATPDAAIDAPPIDAAPPVDAALPVDAAVTKQPPKPPSRPPPPKPPALDQKAIHDVMLAHASQLKQCYETRKLKTLAGRINVHFTIGLDGKVSRTTADGLTKPLQRCVIAVVNGLEFPKPKDKPQDVTYPLDFQTSETPPPTDPKLPKEPNRDQIVAAIQTGLHACTGANGPARIVLQIAPDGSVKQVAVQGSIAAETRTCVTRAVRAMKFEKSAEGVHLDFPLVLQ